MITANTTKTRIQPPSRRSTRSTTLMNKLRWKMCLMGKRHLYNEVESDKDKVVSVIKIIKQEKYNIVSKQEKDHVESTTRQI